MVSSPADVARAWFEQLWNQADESTIDRLLHPGAVIYGLPTASGGPLRGRDEFRPFYRVFRAAFPDLRVEVLDVVAEGDRATAYCRVRGVQKGDLPDCAATNRGVDFTGFAMVRVADGFATEAWNCFDFLAMYRQLGMDLDFPQKSKSASQQ
jgi:predicted ester cyclase